LGRSLAQEEKPYIAQWDEEWEEAPLAAEAEELLRYALKYSPREWKYLNMLAAIGYSKSKNPTAVFEAIEPILKDPDCPVMLKQLAAFLNKKSGNYAAAAAIYADIAATSRDEAYVKNARRELEKLSRAKNPPAARGARH